MSKALFSINPKPVMNKEAINKATGKYLQEIRKTLKISQEDLADKIGLTRTSIVNIEKGRQSLTVENLYKISEVFGISPVNLIIKGEGESVDIVLLAKIKSIEKERDDWKNKYLSLQKSLSEVLGHVNQTVIFK
jgi:transcriptional regulator with XRE-family HTH domain